MVDFEKKWNMERIEFECVQLRAWVAKDVEELCMRKRQKINIKKHKDKLNKGYREKANLEKKVHTLCTRT